MLRIARCVTYGRQISGTRWSVGCGGRVVERRAFGRRDRGSKPPPPFRSLDNFVHPTLPVSFGKDSKSRWFLLSGVCARGRKRSHTVTGK